jgi:hypothetical protein
LPCRFDSLCQLEHPDLFALQSLFRQDGFGFFRKNSEEIEPVALPVKGHELSEYDHTFFPNQ